MQTCSSAEVDLNLRESIIGGIIFYFCKAVVVSIYCCTEKFTALSLSSYLPRSSLLILLDYLMQVPVNLSYVSVLIYRVPQMRHTFQDTLP